MDLSKPWCVLQLTVHLVLVTELGAPGAVLFELDSNLLAIGTDT